MDTIRKDQYVVIVKVAQGEPVNVEGTIGQVIKADETGAYDVKVGELTVKAISVGQISAAEAAEIDRQRNDERRAKEDAARAASARSHTRKPAAGFTKPAEQEEESPAPQAPEDTPAEAPAA